MIDEKHVENSGLTGVDAGNYGGAESSGRKRGGSVRKTESAGGALGNRQDEHEQGDPGRGVDIRRHRSPGEVPHGGERQAGGHDYGLLPGWRPDEVAALLHARQPTA